ncbi:hypothetical protein QUC31_000347 [Theobroma cacao]
MYEIFLHVEDVRALTANLCISVALTSVHILLDYHYDDEIDQIFVNLFGNGLADAHDFIRGEEAVHNPDDAILDVGDHKTVDGVAPNVHDPLAIGDTTDNAADDGAVLNVRDPLVVGDHIDNATDDGAILNVRDPLAVDDQGGVVTVDMVVQGGHNPNAGVVQDGAPTNVAVPHARDVVVQAGAEDAIASVAHHSIVQVGDATPFKGTDVISTPGEKGAINALKVEEKIKGLLIVKRESKSSSSKLLHSKAEKFEIQAGMSLFMDIIINSLYSNKDIFLK